MNRFFISPSLRLLAGAALLLAVGAAQAQYAWINANGTREYSDRPPPPAVPRSKILKAPKGSALLVLEQEAPASAQAAPPTDAKPEAKKGPPTLADREADYRKRQQARAEEDKQAADETRRREALAENCASARQYKAQLESGIRVADTSPEGERAYISDEERAKRLAKTKRILEDCR
jgi:type IV secretory pathway VirB10-like protein